VVGLMVPSSTRSRAWDGVMVTWRRYRLLVVVGGRGGVCGLGVLLGRIIRVMHGWSPYILGVIELRMVSGRCGWVEIIDWPRAVFGVGVQSRGCD
jgi:hypothetical protein